MDDRKQKGDVLYSTEEDPDHSQLWSLADEFSRAFGRAVGPSYLARGEVQRWNGKRTGFTLYEDAHDLFYGEDSVLRDCEHIEVRRIQDALYVGGTHHDGFAWVEIRCLTDAGVAALDDIETLDAEEGFTVTIGGREFKEGEEEEAISALWNDSELCERNEDADRLHRGSLLGVETRWGAQEEPETARAPYDVREHEEER